VVGGHCLGANIAMHFAARHPTRAAGLILIEPMPPEALIGDMRWLRRMRILVQLAALAARGANALGLKRRRIGSIDLRRWDLATESGRRDLASFGSPLSDLRHTPTAAYFQGVLGVLEPLPPAAAIRCPALVLISRLSSMTDAALTRAAMLTLDGVEIVELDTRHWIPTEQPEAMRSAIEAWLARQAPGTASAAPRP
jgi:pimeloyl-ACP methyl ester carboxylesterase